MVRWRGWALKYDSWISEDDFRNINSAASGIASAYSFVTMVRTHLLLFELIVQSTDEQRRAILKTLKLTQLRAILEAIYNVLSGTCFISDKDKRKLIRYKGSFGDWYPKNSTVSSYSDYRTNTAVFYRFY